jgi:CheY-like chemotaxis protein
MPVSTAEFRPTGGSPHAAAIRNDTSQRPKDRRRVLIVEDEAMIALDLSDLLESWGHVVAGVVCTMGDALEAAHANGPDVAIVDVALGIGEDGVRVAAELKRRFACDIVFVTAWSDAGTRARMERVGPTALLFKPYARDALRAALSERL